MVSSSVIVRKGLVINNIIYYFINILKTFLFLVFPSKAEIRNMRLLSGQIFGNGKAGFINECLEYMEKHYGER